MGAAIPIQAVSARAYVIPTDAPEADGTLTWDSTTLVVVRVQAGGHEGLGYTYSDRAAADIAGRLLAKHIMGCDAMAVTEAWRRMAAAVRNIGFGGLCATALSAVDAALWDLKAKLLGLPLVVLLGRMRDAVPIYGSGGFTSYAPDRLAEQLGGWVRQGIARVKMKVGSHPGEDVARVRLARQAIGPDADLFVDANGAYDRAQALCMAARFAEAGVTWFEEPVSSEDRDGLRLMRDRAPPGMNIAAGEYGYDLYEFRALLEDAAVDILQADASRCGGITGFLRVAALCQAHGTPLSAHTAPALHLHVCCAVPNLRHIEYFHDHVRIESLLFDGVAVPQGGMLAPDPSRPGHGLTFNEQAAAPFAV